MAATATPAAARRTRMKYWYAYVGMFYCAWAALVFGHRMLPEVVRQWPIAMVMILGSVVAGSTPMGGGAVSFPYLALWEGIRPDHARTFALLIQSLGMTSAMIFILCRRVRIQGRLLAWTTAGAALGMFVGTVAVAPHVAPVYVKLTFACMWMSFGGLTAARNREFCSMTGLKESGNGEAARLGILLGLTGGIIASIIGVGVEMALYTVLVLLFRCDLKIAVPTAVSAMALASIMGVAVHAGVGDIGRDVAMKFLAAGPIVVFGAPVGTYIVSVIPRIKTLYVVSFLCLIQFIWTLSGIERKAAEWAFVAAVMVLAATGFYIMYRRGRRA